MPRSAIKQIRKQLLSDTAAIINGFRLHSVLSSTAAQAFKQARILSTAFLETVLAAYGENQCRH